MILNFSDAHWNMTKIVCTFKSETKSFQWYLLHLLHEHIAAASSCHKFHNCDFAEWQKFRSFFSDQIQYLHMQFYHFRRIWALKRVSERMWVVGTYFSNDNVVDADDNDMWSISTLLIYIPLIWDEKQFPLKYSFLWQWFIVNSTLLLMSLSQSRKKHHHNTLNWSDFIWLKRIIVIISVNDDNDKWTYKRWCAMMYFKCGAETSIT